MGNYQLGELQNSTSVRLTDVEKLALMAISEKLQRNPSDSIRWLIRLAASSLDSSSDDEVRNLSGKVKHYAC